MSEIAGAELRTKFENPLKFQWGTGGADQRSQSILCCGIQVTPTLMGEMNDPDETEGRKLYRAQADALAASQIAMEKHRIRMRPDSHGQDAPTPSAK